MENGFIRDLLDVKVLVLYVLNLAETALDREKIYELCYVDNRLTYFDICEVLPQLKESGHVEELSEAVYAITEKGKENLGIVAPSLAYTLRSRAAKAVEAYKAESKKNEYVFADVKEENAAFSAAVELKDSFGPLMRLELAAPDKNHARKLSEILKKNAAAIYKSVMDDCMQELEDSENA